MLDTSITLKIGRRLATTTAAILIAASLAGCASKGQLTTGSIGSSRPVESMSEAEIASSAEQIGRAYEKNPADAQTGMRYAALLRMTGKNDQALAVMQQVAIRNPTDRTVLAAYGKTLAAVGDLAKALDTIQRAQTPDRPDWELYSAEGAVLDQLGRPDEARDRYRKALEIRQNEPSVLSNLGMSYLLQGDLRSAETYMRNAVGQPGADSRVRQNLALVVGLQGRFEEAERIAGAELSPEQAQANVKYLRAMLSQQNAWAKLADKDDKSTN